MSITAHATCLTRNAYSSSASFASILDTEDETFPALDFENSKAGAEGTDGTEFFSDTHFAVMRDMNADADASMDFDAV